MAHPLESTFQDLINASGVDGLALFRGDEVLLHDLGGIYQGGEVDSLTLVMSHFMSGMTSVDRHPREVLFEFSSGSILFMTHHIARLFMLLSETADLGNARSRADDFLRDNYGMIRTYNAEERSRQRARESAQQNWDRYVERLRKLLGKVLSGPQADTLINRVVARENGQGAYMISQERYREIGELILKEVPNSGRQRALMAELDAISKRPEN